MGVVSDEFATPAAVAPARLFKAMSTDFHNVFPKIVEPIQSVEFIEGTGAAGTIKKMNVLDGGESKYMLHRVDEVDEAKLVYNFSIIGGTGLADPLEKVQFKSKFVEGPNGGCIREVQAQYFTKGDTTLSEETVKASQAKVNGIVKIAEGFLLANPDYN